MKTTRRMLNKWAAQIDERRTILAFLDWWYSQKSQAFPNGLWEPESFLDEYHGIDQAALERERRALLETMR